MKTNSTDLMFFATANEIFIANRGIAIKAG
jgi:hypothetical protein